MEQLKAEHIAPYLPYGLKCQYKSMLGNSVKVGRIHSLSETHISFEHRMYWQIKDCKPILKPMEDAEEYFERLYGMLEHQDVTDYLDEDYLNSMDNLDISEIGFKDVEYLPYGTLKVLLKHHFDVFGLIEEGLAIPVTEDFNPYK